MNIFIWGFLNITNFNTFSSRKVDVRWIVWAESFDQILKVLGTCLLFLCKWEKILKPSQPMKLLGCISFSCTFHILSYSGYLLNFAMLKRKRNHRKSLYFLPFPMLTRYDVKNYAILNFQLLFHIHTTTQMYIKTI